MTDPVEVPRKWRPPVALIVVSVMLSVLALPVGILIWVGLIDFSAGGPSVAGIVGLSLALLLTLAVALVLTRTITGPVNALIGRADAIARSGKAAIRPLDAYGTREFATLSRSLLELATRMIERTDYVRSFAAHVSHELRSPLTAIQGAAELLRDEDETMSPADRRRFLDNIVADTGRLALLLQRLRELAYAELPTSAGETTLGALAVDLGPRFPALRIETDPSDATIALRHEAAIIALVHLAENAVQHGADVLRLSVHRTGPAAILRVADNGTGIAPGNREKIFQPFFSTRREAGGTGMGLDIARAALRSQGADIALQPGDEGAVFRIALPPL